MEVLREDQIFDLLKKNRKVFVSELVASMGVSEVTIRKDLANLIEQGKEASSAFTNSLERSRKR